MFATQCDSDIPTHCGGGGLCSARNLHAMHVYIDGMLVANLGYARHGRAKHEPCATHALCGNMLLLSSDSGSICDLLYVWFCRIESLKSKKKS